MFITEVMSLSSTAVFTVRLENLASIKHYRLKVLGRIKTVAVVAGVGKGSDNA